MSAPTTDSHMYKAMHEQPETVQRLLDEGWGVANEGAQKLSRAQRIFVIGIGTSYHAALMGAWFLRSAGADARAIHSFDFAHYPDNFPVASSDAIIIMTHTGIKTFSLVAMERAQAAGATLISIGSKTAEHPGSELVLRTTEREKSSAYTVSHMAAMTVLAQLAVELAEMKGGAIGSEYRNALSQLPGQIDDILRRKDEVKPVAEESVSRQVYVAGAGPNEFSAIEAVIKVREAAYGRIDALGLEQFLHGPIVSFNEGDGAILVNVTGNSEQRVNEVGAVLNAMGGRLWVVGKPLTSVDNAPTFTVPETIEDLSPLLTVVPLQLYAYFMAVAKGINPDTFRRDQPKYSDAFSLIKL